MKNINYLGKGRRQRQRLRDAAASIRSEPLSYDQDRWFSHTVPKSAVSAADTIGDCGGLACLAGHITWNEGYRPTGRYMSDGKVSKPRGKLKFETHELAAQLVGLKADDIHTRGSWIPWLFGSHWRPKGWTPQLGYRAVANRVADALEALADGASLEDVSMTDAETTAARRKVRL